MKTTEKVETQIIESLHEKEPSKMRVNIYHEELTFDSAIVWAKPRPGVRYCGLRIFQKSTPELHTQGEDDDRSAVTFWFPSLAEARAFLRALSRTVDERADG